MFVKESEKVLTVTNGCGGIDNIIWRHRLTGEFAFCKRTSRPNGVNDLCQPFSFRISTIVEKITYYICKIQFRKAGIPV